MRRALALALCAALLPAAASAAKPTIGISGYGGASIPIVQDDTGSGPIFGARVPVTLLPILSVEPYFARSSHGDGEETFAGFTYTRDGFSQTAFGVNVMLGSLAGSGFHFYPFAGIGSNKLTRDGSDDIQEVGYNFGLGLGVSPAPRIAVHLRGELNMVVTDDTSRKFGVATVGVSYDVWPRP